MGKVHIACCGSTRSTPWPGHCGMSNRDSASPIDAAPTHKPPLGALLEVAGLWWLILCAGVLLIAVLLLRVYGTEVNHIQHARVSLTVTELQESIETDIALGLDLSENRAIQAQLERALAADPALHAIEVVRKDGVALFSTDRGAIGESWQPAVAVAAAQGEQQRRQWTATLGGEAITGVLLQNAFGEVVGHVSATYAAPPSRISLQALRNATPLWLATAAVMLALAIAAVLAARWALKPQYRYLHDEQNTAMAQALASAQAVRTRMDDCITTLDESEASQ